MAWKDPKTIAAIAQYMRLLTGILLVLLLLWMFVEERIDLADVIKAMLTLLAVDRFGVAIAARRDHDA